MVNTSHRRSCSPNKSTPSLLDLCIPKSPPPWLLTPTRSLSMRRGLSLYSRKMVFQSTSMHWTVHISWLNTIPRERVCIKIPVTPQAVVACKELAKSGINSLGTSLFTVPQAIAASQAGCFYVAPYFNRQSLPFSLSYIGPGR
jgi:hypothetical protein